MTEKDQVELYLEVLHMHAQWVSPLQCLGIYFGKQTMGVAQKFIYEKKNLRQSDYPEAATKKVHQFMSILVSLREYQLLLSIGDKTVKRDKPSNLLTFSLLSFQHIVTILRKRFTKIEGSTSALLLNEIGKKNIDEESHSI